MADTKANEAARDLVKSVQETNKAIADTAVTTQERNLAFAQNVLENSVEVLRSHAESSRTLMQELVERAKEQQIGVEGIQSIVDSAVAAQDRNTKLAQNVLENGIEVLKSQVDVTRSLMQELGQQFQRQQDAFQAIAQESVDAYKDFIFAPLNFWQKAMSTAEATTLEGLKTFQRASEQGLENFQRSARQAASVGEKTVRNSQSAARKTAE